MNLSPRVSSETSTAELIVDKVTLHVPSSQGQVSDIWELLRYPGEDETNQLPSQ